MEMSALQHKNHEIYITSSFPFTLSTASLPAVVPDTLAFISESFPFNEVRSAGRSASFLSVSAVIISTESDAYITPILYDYPYPMTMDFLIHRDGAE